MSEWIIYGKRTGKKVNNIPVYDKQFRALNYEGVRVSKLADADTYATKEDAQAIIDDEKNKKLVEDGLVQYEIRRAK